MAGVAAFAMLLVWGCGKDVTEPPPDIDIEPDVDPVTVQLVFPGLRAEATAASADSIPAIRETQLTDSFTVAFWDGNGQVFVPGPDDRVEINVGAGSRWYQEGARPSHCEVSSVLKPRFRCRFFLGRESASRPRPSRSRCWLCRQPSCWPWVATR